jgi:hypothetical protein
LSTLGGWLARAGANVPAEAGAFFVAGLKEKETLRRAHLRALRKAFTSSDLSEKVRTRGPHLPFQALVLNFACFRMGLGPAAFLTSMSAQEWLQDTSPVLQFVQRLITS